MTDDPALELVTAIVRALTQPLAQQPAMPALDIADYRGALVNSGRAFFGEAEAAGAPFEGRATRAADAALREAAKAMKGWRAREDSNL